jgi:putative transposase
MPRNLIRLQRSGQFHFITLSCHQRKPFLARAGRYAVFENELETARHHYAFVIAGYVLMPEHVHLLISEPRLSSLSVALQVLKQETSTRLKQLEDTHFRLPRYYDFNVFSDGKWMEKLKYMHRNPVQRGLVEKPEDWPWSSFAITRPAKQEWWKSSRTGQREEGNW